MKDVLTHEQICNPLVAQALNPIKDKKRRALLVEGAMGWGKTSILRMLAERLPKHLPCYFDCMTKDLGDITIPDLMHMDDGSGFVRYLTNEELGAHTDKPVILMLDEWGKCNPAVLNATLRIVQEGKIGSYTFHPDSVIFCTSNLAVEGVGDRLLAHQDDRTTRVELAKPTPMQWIEWGYNNNIHTTVLAWANDNDQLFADFRSYEDPEENQYIPHPRSSRRHGVTGRSLEAASSWLHLADQYDEQTLKCLLIGTIGNKAAGDLMAFAKLASNLPSMESIKTDPKNATVPETAAALMMVVYRVMDVLDAQMIDPWFTYMQRMPSEVQAVFVSRVRQLSSDLSLHPKAAKLKKRILENKVYTDWARDNNFLFVTDKV
tara:strand:+ start:105 stop:1232 length:1128 start_codon:yes stop_codon:yes gene_type:complete